MHDAQHFCAIFYAIQDMLDWWHWKCYLFSYNWHHFNRNTQHNSRYFRLNAFFTSISSKSKDEYTYILKLQSEFTYLDNKNEKTYGEREKNLFRIIYLIEWKTCLQSVYASYLNHNIQKYMRVSHQVNFDMGSVTFHSSISQVKKTHVNA